MSDLAWKMHDEFLAVPGYAAHVAAPHRHNPEAFARLHGSVVRAFTVAGASPEMAQQSWFVFGLGWCNGSAPNRQATTSAPTSRASTCSWTYSYAAYPPKTPQAELVS